MFDDDGFIEPVIDGLSNSTGPAGHGHSRVDPASLWLATIVTIALAILFLSKVAEANSATDAAERCAVDSMVAIGQGNYDYRPPSCDR